jgi:hypothetical protein
MQASAVDPSDVKNVAGVFNALIPLIPGRVYSAIVVRALYGWEARDVYPTPLPSLSGGSATDFPAATGGGL